MARFCFCDQAVFGTDKKTGIGYCKNHQYMRTDLDRRSISQKAADKHSKLGKNIRGLYKPEDSEIGSLQALSNDLDKVFSLYIRLKFADENGIVTCFVCDTPYHYLKLDNGHYISRGNKGTRFLEENCYPQCKWCNNLHNENPLPFKEAIERYKPGLTAFLEDQETNAVFKYDLDELKQLLITYRSKLKTVQSKLK